MIAEHAKLARCSREQLGLPDVACDGLAGAYERWDGKGWPGTRAGKEVPFTSRIAQLAEFVEVAPPGSRHRRGCDARAIAARGHAVRSRSRRAPLRQRGEIFGGLDASRTGPR